MREMRDSGFGYLGEIPAHWRIERIKNHLRFSPDKNPGNAMILSLYREHGIVPKDSRDDNHNVTSEDTSNYRYVQVGDFVVNKMKAWQGSMGVSGYEGVVSPAYYVYRFTTDDFDKKYLHYLLRSKCYADEFRRQSGGIRIGQWDLPKVGFETTYLSVPPKEEQTVIAEYIDAQLNKVDTLVVNVQAQIEKFKAYKQSLITEVVTKGLDPNVPMKDSGVEWIGEIPKHWGIEKIKFNVSVNTEKQSDLDLPYIALEHIEGFSGKRIETDSVYDITDAIVAHRGEILFGKLRPYLAKVYVVEEETYVSSEFAVFNVSTVNNQYFKWYMLSYGFLDTINASTYGTKMPRANIDFIKNLYIPILDIVEQKQIASFLDEKCSQIDRLIALKEAKIEKLEQYKKSLIYEYVTGKKEVH